MIMLVKPDEQRRGVLGRVLIFAAWSLPALCALYVMCTHWVAVPFWDEWDAPGAQLAAYYRGTLTFAELFSQHNEHRLLFPRLVWLPIVILTGAWDVRHEMVLTFCLVTVASVSLYRLLRFSGDPIGGRILAFGVMNLLLFSPRQYDSFLVGAQGQTFVPTFALLFALLMNLSRISLRTKTIVNAALALIGTYSFGNGMLIWLLAFPVETETGDNSIRARPETKIFWRAAYIMAGAICIFCYFISYRHPPLSPPLVSPLANATSFVRFVLVWAGSLFSTSAPGLCGVVLLLLFAGLTSAAVLQIRRTGAWQPHYPWLLLASYTLMSAGIAAVARLGFEPSMAGDARYAAFSAFFSIAVAGLAFSVYAQSKKRSPAIRIALPALVVSLLLVLWIATFKKERTFLRAEQERRKHSLLVVRWSDAIPENPDLAFSSPYSREETLATIRTLADRDVLRPGLVNHSLAAAVKEQPAAFDRSAGALEQAALDPNNFLFCKGWARVPNENRPADCVVLGFESDEGQWQPFCVLETGEKRPDLAPGSASPLTRAGFSRIIDARTLPRNAATMRAWSIDLRNERAFPMEGAITLHR
jgi:hypothetical protein